MKYLIVLLLFFLVGCSNTAYVGYMNESKTNPKTGKFETIEYSPYYELEFRTEDRVVLSRLVISLGPERVPPGYQHSGTFAKDLQRSYRDGIVPWVTEIYYINTSDEEISVKPTYVKVGHKTKNFEHNYTITPSKWKITEPVIFLTSNYGTQTDVEYKFIYNGKEEHVVGIAKRLTKSEVKAKYSN